MDRVGDALDVRAFGGDGVTADEVIQIFESFCDAEFPEGSGLVADPGALNSIRCETDNGVPVHPHDVLRAALAGHVRRVVLDSAGHVIDFGRKKRFLPVGARTPQFDRDDPDDRPDTPTKSDG